MINGFEEGGEGRVAGEFRLLPDLFVRRSKYLQLKREMGWKRILVEKLPLTFLQE